MTATRMGTISAMLLALAAGGCSKPPEPPAADPVGQAGAPTAPPAPGGDLLGLYERASGARRDQLCLIGNARTARFGLVVWGEAQRSCSGIGTATRSGDRITLEMRGDSLCRIEAAIDGSGIALPASLPAGCAYYCGTGTAMTGVRFARAGDGEAAALRAKDLVGDTLCDAT